ncbi:MAG: helix-turn-helix transcriptional regulator [Spirochaetaceae bacterium]|nr:helix-turn-helix transcriptional regulator [Spirochaetaceae bacterium]
MQKNEEICECEIIHEDTVKKVRATFPKDEMIFDLADFYKIFGDTTRVKILYALDKSELCVCDISALLGMSVSAVSHQLRTLRDSNLVKTQRDGKVVYYSLADDHVKSVLECGIEHIQEEQK